MRQCPSEPEDDPAFELRKQALLLAHQLPNNEAEALQVLDYTRELVLNFMRRDTRVVKLATASMPSMVPR